ncbi:MAG TPA: MlaD family protein [Actinomycetota bacterium]|nr:MlaD family protein [Actinomycetota bacterium]
MNAGLRAVSAKLAIFTVVTIAVTFWLASVIGNLDLFSHSYSVDAEFTDASGLLVGDVVKAAGVDIGRVEDIRIDDGIAVVTLSLDEDAEVPASVRAQIRFRNLVGQRMVTLTDDGPQSSTTLADGALIPLDRTEPAFDLTVLFNGLRPLIRSTDPRDINIVTHALTKALAGRGDDVEGLLDHVAAFSDSLASKDRELSSLLSSVNVVTSDLSTRDAQLRRTLSNLDSFLGDLDASRSQLADALVTLDDAATRLRRVVANNDDNIRSEVADLATVLDAVDDNRGELRSALRELPSMLVAVERVNGYGEWANLHLVNVCKDDFGTCGTRGRP